MPEIHPPTPSRPQIVLGFDFGQRRIGVAVGDTLTRSARPLATVTSVDEIASQVAAAGPAMLVVGCPYQADGSAGPMTRRARAFADELGRRFGLPVHLVDERYSSIEAEAELRGRRASGERRRRVRKSDIDRVSAAVILERWLAGEGATPVPTPPGAG